MALGGRHRRATVDNEPGIAHFCGSPQGRTPAESGPSGCTLVHVVDGKTQTKFISTDIIRWVDESIEVTASTTIEQLEERMDERLDKLRQKSQGTDLLVSFHVRGTGPLVTLLRPGHETDALIARLQKRASKRSPLCWTVGLGCLSAPTVPEEWYDQETILGDFLRQLAEYEEDPRKSLELETLLPTPLSSEVLKSVAKFKNQDHRTRVIENSKKLGIELLTSPEAAMQLG
jgi:exonuclease SbcD